MHAVLSCMRSASVRGARGVVMHEECVSPSRPLKRPAKRDHRRDMLHPRSALMINPDAQRLPRRRLLDEVDPEVGGGASRQRDVASRNAVDAGARDEPERRAERGCVREAAAQSAVDSGNRRSRTREASDGARGARTESAARECRGSSCRRRRRAIRTAETRFLPGRWCSSATIEAAGARLTARDRQRGRWARPER